LVSGQIAPPDRFYDISLKAAADELWDTLPKARKQSGEDRQERVASAVRPLADALKEAAAIENESPQDELTLLDAKVFPAVGTRESIGQSFPVLRVPISAVSTWWLFSGGEM
jgi:hypothetical protein